MQSARHGFRYAPRQGQSEARPVNLRSLDFWTAIERFEDMRKISTTDANSVVLNTDLHLGLSPYIADPGPDPDPSVLSAVFDGVHNQILKTMRQCGSVRHHLRQVVGQVRFGSSHR